MISIVIPTLNRSDQLQKVLERLAITTTRSVSEVIVVTDDGDTASIKACIDTIMDPNYSHLNLRCVKEDGHPTAVEKWNIGARFSRYKNHNDAWLMLAADDLYFPGGWLEAALDTPNQGFIALGDGRNPKAFEPHYMATIHWLRQFQNGVLCVPHYKQWGLDLEVAARAHASGTYVKSSMDLVHNHVVWGTAPNDDTYKRGALHHEADLHIFNDRREHDFPNDFEGYL